MTLSALQLQETQDLADVDRRDGHLSAFWKARVDAMVAELRRMSALLNTPEIEYFDRALPLEAAHQVERWGKKHDETKDPEEWFWVVGYLAGKALAAQKGGDTEKAKHHCVSTAAVLRNWHAHLREG